MPLDDLHKVIEVVQGRITSHGDLLRQNEFRTRLALIDPLLEALGWNVGDPALVIPEYDVSGKRADYALLGSNRTPAVFLEAKKLDDSLSNHRSQVVAYASELGIRYPALTNGNNWEVYDNSMLVPIEERRLLNVEIARAPAATSALQLLFLWRANVATGKAALPTEPMLMSESNQPEVGSVPDSASVGTVASPNLDGLKWKSLINFQAGEVTRPPRLRLPDGKEVQPKFWYSALVEVAEWLIRAGHLTPQVCPLDNRGRVYIVHSEPRHPSGREFYQPYTLSNGLFLNKHGNKETVLKYAELLMERFQQEPTSISFWVS